MLMFTLFFWKAAAERGLKTAAQNGVIALGAVAWTDIDQVIPAGAAIGLAMSFGFVLSILTSMASSNIGNAGPSLANETLVVDVDHDDWTEFDHTVVEEPRGGYATDQG